MLGGIVITTFLFIGVQSSMVFAQSTPKQQKKVLVKQKKVQPIKTTQKIVKKKMVSKSPKKSIVKSTAKPLKVRAVPKAKPKTEVLKEDLQEGNDQQELLELEQELNNASKELSEQEELVEEVKLLTTPTPSPVLSGDVPVFAPQQEGPVWEKSEKEKNVDETKTKLEALKKKISEIKKVEPVEVKKIETKTPLKNIGNPYIDSYENEDKPMREYWKTHPGSYGPPLLKYNLPSGIF